jgi:hypothetical protein
VEDDEHAQQEESPSKPQPATAPTKPVAAVGTASAAVLNPKRVYWAVKVNSSGFDELTKAVHALIADTGYTQLVPKAGEMHATLLFMGRDRSKEAPIVPLNGAPTPLTITQVVVTPRLACAAVRIENPAVAAVATNACSHLTLALAPKVPAKESNDVLEAVAAGRAQKDWIVLGEEASVVGSSVEGVVCGM